MTVSKAHSDRRGRYARWVALLQEEVELIAKPHARIVAIGREVRALLDDRHGFARDITPVMHYSPQASRYRDTAVEERGPEFQAFVGSLSMEDIVATADAFMREHSVPFALFSETITRLRKAKLTDSRKKLAFIYVTAFRR
jgi:hypothetical protein